MRALAAGARYELAIARTSPTELSWLFVAPLYALIFLSIFQHAGRTDLAAYAVLGPASMAVIGMAITSAGGFIDRDRHDGVLELEIAAPVSFPVLLAGRILAVVSVGLLGVVEAWLVAGLVFGHWVTISHPFVFAVTLALTVAATAGAATMMAAVFVLSRSARIFQNSLSFPLFVLGGALVPVQLLPDWLRPLSRIVYLSWATDLLRDSTRPDTVTDLAGRWAALIGLGIASFAVGSFMVGRVVRRARSLGSVSHV